MITPKHIAALAADFDAAYTQFLTHTHATLKHRGGGPWPTAYLERGRQNHGAVKYVKTVLARPAGASFDAPIEQGHPELTFEYLALDPRWLPLFADADLDPARSRLRAMWAGTGADTSAGQDQQNGDDALDVIDTDA